MNDNTKPGKIMDGVCFSTEHTYKKGDKEIPYICEAQEFIFLDEMEQPEASFFLYSYLRQDVDCKDDRPLIFNYGGGPGNSSTPLSMWGPKMMDPSFKKCVGPYPEPIDNQDWLIDVADIILIDPPGTGLGRIYQYDKRSKYWGVQPDAVAFIDMFKHWLTKYDRWYSPKYIAGTSYGGFRTAVLSDLLCGGPYYTEQRQYALFVAGQIPATEDGGLLHTGKVGGEVTLEQAQDCARQCILNMLSAVQAFTGDLDKVKNVVKVQAFVSSVVGFDQQHIVINAASQLLYDVFGESGRHARTAVAVNQLPLDAPVEIEAIFEV